MSLVMNKTTVKNKTKSVSHTRLSTVWEDNNDKAKKRVVIRMLIANPYTSPVILSTVQELPHLNLTSILWI